MSSATEPGDAVDDRTVPFPPHVPLHGVYTSLVPVSISHSPSLFTNLGGATNAALWTWLPFDPIPDQAVFDVCVGEWSRSTDPQRFAVIDKQGDALGIMALLCIVPEHRRLELGWIVLGNALKRTRMSTEGFYLLLRRAFELGYQRVEWRTNSLNKESMAAAERLGFCQEGTFRKHQIHRGKRRDTTWFSITDDEWPGVKRGLETWLDESNFDEEGRQKRSLKECRDDLK